MVDLPSGFHVRLKEQKYFPVEVRPYVGKEGRPTFLIVWVSGCADCGAEFHVTTALAFPFNVTRRCDACKTPGKPVGGRSSWWARRNPNQRR